MIKGWQMAVRWGVSLSMVSGYRTGPLIRSTVVPTGCPVRRSTPTRQHVKRALSAVLIIALFSAPLAAQGVSRFAWAPSHQDEARSLSDALAGAQGALYLKHLIDAPDQKRAWTCGALRMGVTFGATSLVKLLVHRERPDGSNGHSFWSGHAANSMAMAGWSYGVGVPISLGTGYLRVGANKHWPTDVLAGWGAGALANLICRGDDGYQR